jgi:hypothetical protein
MSGNGEDRSKGLAERSVNTSVVPPGSGQPDPPGQGDRNPAGNDQRKGLEEAEGAPRGPETARKP